MYYTSNKLAFTLAEVLITIGIIGVIAAITIPILINEYQIKLTITALKKDYSILSQAYSRATQDNGSPDTWNLIAAGDGTGATNMLNILAPYLSLAKNCGTNTGCFPTNVDYKTLYGSSFGIFDTQTITAKAQLIDGTPLSVYIHSPNCSNSYGSSLALSNVCADIEFDTNGFKGPNQNGVDSFTFYVTKYGIVPRGSSQETSGATFASKCSDKTSSGTSGLGCSAWVIYNENIDYLKCPAQLSWTGNLQCP